MKTSNFMSLCIWSLIILCGYSLPPTEHLGSDEQRQLYSKPVLLGSGGFASVYKVNVNGSYFALKVPKASGSAKQKLRQEIGILKFLQKNLDDDERPFFVLPLIRKRVRIPTHPSMSIARKGILLPLYESGDLSKFLKSPDEKDWREVTELALDIVRSLDALKKVNVIHMDIKPQNILLRQSGSRLTASLTDFGGSAILNRIESFCCSSGYCAPECFVPVPTSLSSAIDVFAFGSVLLQLIHRRHYSPKNLEYLQSLVLSQPYHSALTNIHPIVKQCWSPYPDVRPTPAELVGKLSLLLESSEDP